MQRTCRCHPLGKCLRRLIEALLRSRYDILNPNLQLIHNLRLTLLACYNVKVPLLYAKHLIYAISGVFEWVP